MKCLNCGIENDNYICPNCLSQEVIRNVCDEIMDCKFINTKYKDSVCLNPHTQSFLQSCTSDFDFETFVENILKDFKYGNDDYFKCRFMFSKKDANFKYETLKYLNNNELWNLEKQRILLDYLRHHNRSGDETDFEASYSWSCFIRDTDDLIPELYYEAANYFAQIGDYSLTDTIIERYLSNDKLGMYDNHLYIDLANLVNGLIKLNERYKSGKPYWPKFESRRLSLSKIYDQKGIDHKKRITNKTKSVKEDEFESIDEYDGNPCEVNSYTCFWCSAIDTNFVKDMYQIAAIKIKNGVIVKKFQEVVKYRDGINKKIIKHYNFLNQEIEKADEIDIVTNRFFEFVGGDILVSTDAFSSQGQIISRSARHAGLKKIENKFMDLLDFAAEVSTNFDGKNNSREFLVQFYSLTEGEDSLSKAELNYKIFELLKHEALNYEK